MNVLDNHTYIYKIVEGRRNSFGETIKIIVCKLLRNSNLVVLELLNSKAQSLRRDCFELLNMIYTVLFVEILTRK